MMRQQLPWGGGSEGERGVQWGGSITAAGWVAALLPLIIAAHRGVAADKPAAAAPEAGGAANTFTLPPRTPPTLGEARKGYRTTLSRQVATQDPIPAPPPRLFRVVKYDAPVGKLSAYLTPDPGDRRKRPAIIWITGGDCNSIGDVWSPAPPANDQTAGAYRQAGIVMMFPSLRGGSGNPGHKEGFYGEVDDVLAAAAFLAAQPHVDPKRIYLGGHSTGGSLALLAAAAAAPDQFRAVFSFGPAEDVASYGAEAMPFDLGDLRERWIRAPRRWLHGIKTPTFVFEGDGAPSNRAALVALAGAAAAAVGAPAPAPAVRCFSVRGKDHCGVLAPLNALIAAKINRDPVGPGRAAVTNISFSEKEMPGLTPITPPADAGAGKATTAAGPVVMTLTAKTATEPELRMNVDPLAWELGGAKVAGGAAVERYHGKYVEVRGAADGPGSSSVRVDAGSRAGDSFSLACDLVDVESQRRSAESLTRDQEVLVRGVLEFADGRWRMRESAVTAVGPDPSVRVTVDELRRAFAADAKRASARFAGAHVVLDGVLRAMDGAEYHALVDGARPAAGAPPARVALGVLEFGRAKGHAVVGSAVRVKAHFVEFRGGQLVLDQGRVVPAAPTATTSPGAPAAVPTIGPVEPNRKPPPGGAATDRAAPELVGTATGRPGSYSFRKSKRMIAIRYDLMKQGGALRTVSAFTATPPLRGTEKLVQARDGYMVYGLVVDADERVNAIRVIFVRADGDKVVPTDTYESDWLGTPRTGKPVTLGVDGRRVSGMRFYDGDGQMNAIGLLFGN